jgi:hypothetical protein
VAAREDAWEWRRRSDRVPTTSRRADEGSEGGEIRFQRLLETLAVYERLRFVPRNGRLKSKITVALTMHERWVGHTGYVS